MMEMCKHIKSQKQVRCQNYDQPSTLRGASLRSLIALHILGRKNNYNIINITIGLLSLLMTGS